MRSFKIPWFNVWVIRFGGLLLSTPFFVLFKYLKGVKFITDDNNNFLNYIKKLKTSINSKL